jgi:hypothetical protein
MLWQSIWQASGDQLGSEWYAVAHPTGAVARGINAVAKLVLFLCGHFADTCPHRRGQIAASCQQHDAKRRSLSQQEFGGLMSTRPRPEGGIIECEHQAIEGLVMALRIIL